MRDFSANALMYDPLRGVVLDAVGGVGDLAARRLRLLSEGRIREDPVRILRGIRWVRKGQGDCGGQDGCVME
jgi:poly(A) polymerase